MIIKIYSIWYLFRLLACVCSFSRRNRWISWNKPFVKLHSSLLILHFKCNFKCTDTYIHAMFDGDFIIIFVFYLSLLKGIHRNLSLYNTNKYIKGSNEKKSLIQIRNTPFITYIFFSLQFDTIMCNTISMVIPYLERSIQ